MARILVAEGTERKAELPRGAYSRIARRMRPQVSRQMVRLVALGLAKSARVAAAIERFKQQNGVAA